MPVHDPATSGSPLVRGCTSTTDPRSLARNVGPLRFRRDPGGRRTSPEERDRTRAPRLAFRVLAAGLRHVSHARRDVVGRELELRSVFARTWGYSIGKVGGDDDIALARDAWRLVGDAGCRDDAFPHVHVWQRERSLPGDDDYDGAADELARTIGALLVEQRPERSTLRCRQRRGRGRRARARLRARRAPRMVARLASRGVARDALARRRAADRASGADDLARVSQDRRGARSGRSCRSPPATAASRSAARPAGRASHCSSAGCS